MSLCWFFRERMNWSRVLNFCSAIFFSNLSLLEMTLFHYFLRRVSEEKWNCFGGTVGFFFLFGFVLAKEWWSRCCFDNDDILNWFVYISQVSVLYWLYIYVIGGFFVYGIYVIGSCLLFICFRLIFIFNRIGLDWIELNWFIGLVWEGLIGFGL